MQKTIGKCLLTTCTALAATIGDSTRQPALFLHQIGDIFHDGDSVIFGYSLDDFDNSFNWTDPDFAAACSSNHEDLATVRFVSESDAYQEDCLINWPQEVRSWPAKTLFLIHNFAKVQFSEI